MPVFNYSDYSNELRDIVCSNPILDVYAAEARCDTSNIDENFSRTPTFPRIRNNFVYAMDADSMRNTLESMAPNAVFGDLAVLRDRQFIPRSRERAEELLRKLREDDRRFELVRIKALRIYKATIRYRIEVSNE